MAFENMNYENMEWMYFRNGHNLGGHDIVGNIARKVMSYGTTTRSFDGNEMYITHAICSTDTLQGIALKYGVTMEHLRRVNRLYVSDSIHLRKLLLIPIPATLDESLRRSRSENGFVSVDLGSPRNANFPAGSRENPLSKAEASALLKTIDGDVAGKDPHPGTPESSSSSGEGGPPAAPGNPAPVSPLDYFSRIDQSIASCRKNTENTASSWSSRSYSMDPPKHEVRTNGNGASRSPSWGRIVKATKPHPELQLEGVDNMVFEL